QSYLISFSLSDPATEHVRFHGSNIFYFSGICNSNMLWKNRSSWIKFGTYADLSTTVVVLRMLLSTG
ncbi:MAG TPA: hypothetical protein VGB89_11620, partial [Bacteroidota bacterium]